MEIRTDLAIERREVSAHPDDGMKIEEFTRDDIKVTRIEVQNEKGERELGRPIGSYITVETPPLSNETAVNRTHMQLLRDEIARLIPSGGTVLVCGIGNTQITPDALGPKVASLILATRHISGELARSAGLGKLRPVAAVAPGVLGQTGMETGEMLNAIIQKIRPSAVIAVDALASRRLARLGCTVQIADTGIVPGSGVGNARTEISRRTLGIPVLSVGVPTVVDASTLARDISGSQGDFADARMMIVTPKEIDMLIDRAARLISHAINCALQPHLEPDDLLMLTG